MFLLTLFYNAFSLHQKPKVIYRCATVRLPLRNGNLTFAQEQGCRCAAVSKKQQPQSIPVKCIGKDESLRRVSL